MPEPKVSVVIPTCNRPDLLAKCLDALAVSLSGEARELTEVIVTDDGADDSGEHLVTRTYPWVMWTRGPRRGPAANRNHGVGAARGLWIVFTDDDCLPSPEWLLAFLEQMSCTPACNVFEGRTFADRDRRRLDEESPENLRGGYLWSCNMAIRRELFERIGGFCQTFPHAAMEDYDLRLRLDAAGEPFVFVPDAVVCHPYRAAKGLRFVARAGASFLHLVERHPTVLGDRPWLTFAASLQRRSRQLLKDAVRCRFRGFGYAVCSFAIWTYFDLVARTKASVRSGHLRRSVDPSR